MNRSATLKELHEVIVTMMAIRYGAARHLERDGNLDYELVTRARSRRFGAMQRLLRGLT